MRSIKIKIAFIAALLSSNLNANANQPEASVEQLPDQYGQTSNQKTLLEASCSRLNTLEIQSDLNEDEAYEAQLLNEMVGQICREPIKLDLISNSISHRIA